MTRRGTLSRSDAMWIRSNHHKLKHIPEPDSVWEWSDVAIDHGTLCALMHRSLIHEVDCGWMTDRRLYTRMEEEDWLVDVLGDPNDDGQLRFAESVVG